jgi:hypothetical protein
VKERAGQPLELIVVGNDFLSRTQKAQQLRERIEVKKLLHRKGNGNQIEEAGSESQRPHVFSHMWNIAPLQIQAI